jgi:hypothetical protein
MNRKLVVPRALLLAALIAIVGAVPGSSAAVPVGGVRAGGGPLYVADFVSTAADGIDMNDGGDVTGTSYPDPGCGPFCLPPLETVVWRDGQRIVLPPVPGFSDTTVRGINDEGWVAGFAGDPDTTAHAVVWKPVGDTYEAMDLGVLPGKTVSEAIGIDDQGRAVGWSTTETFPPDGSPFMWTESDGMVDLSAQGFPDEIPQEMSPGGTVVTADHWYRLEDPGSVVAMPPAPEGFAIGTDPMAINDAGDQARFLVSLGGQSLRYLFRFHHQGTWQQISFIGVKQVAYDVGSISDAKDVTATVAGAGRIAFGPNGLTQPLADLLSPAYRDRVVTFGGPMNESGQILAQVLVGRDDRLMRLVPAAGCGANCIRIASLRMRGRFVDDPSDPGSCAPDLDAYNLAMVKLTVTSETGARLGDVLVQGRFLDDYWTNAPVSGTTNANGVVTFRTRGPCGVGAVAFLVDSATKGNLTFDRTVGVVTGWVIPQLREG